jgi:hypothetical protein
MHAVKFKTIVAACIFSFVVFTLQAQEPTPTPTPTPDTSPTPTPNTSPDINSNHQVPAGMGQAIIDAADDSNELVTTAEQLDAVRLEIITLRRFVVIIGGIFLGWMMMLQLFRAH